MDVIMLVDRMEIANGKILIWMIVLDSASQQQEARVEDHRLLFLCVGFAFWAAFSLELLLVFFNDAVCHTSVKDTMKQHKSGKSSINVSVWIDDVDSWADNLRINLCIYIFFFSPFFCLWNRIRFWPLSI